MRRKRTMTNSVKIDRRRFVMVSTAVAGSAIFGLHLPLRQAAAQTLGKEPWTVGIWAGGAEMNAWLVIGADDTVLFRVAKPEMGQGSLTVLPLIICEELECDWSKVKVEYADPNRSLRESNIYRSFG